MKEFSSVVRRRRVSRNLNEQTEKSQWKIAWHVHEKEKNSSFFIEEKMFWIFLCRFPFQFSFSPYFSGPDFSWENDSFRYSNWIQIFSLLLVVCLSYFPDKSQHRNADTLSCENEEFFSNISISFFPLFSLSSRNLINIKAASLGGKSWICRQLGGVFCHFKFLIDSISLPETTTTTLMRVYGVCWKTKIKQIEPNNHIRLSTSSRLNMTAKHMHNWLQKP